MTSSTSARRRHLLASAAVAVLLLTGCATGTSAQSVAAPAAAAATPAFPVQTAAATQTAAPSSSPTSAPQKVLPASDPVSVSVPSAGIDSELLSLGLKADGSVEVPPDGPGAPAGWYNGSPTPGELGPAVLLGHVNATGGGPGVFANLRELKTGDLIRVARQDGTTSVFTFDHADAYSKDAFPTQTVYGNTEGPELRLITCDGYDPATGLFDDNYVVFAKLVA
ncbi:class F sortase [Arthrobacter sp. NPDC057013]|uniref:class F sortase n=1 Tax=Arthrobacter sp. NPDC057013 TaxID=3345999 RepID=UPI0036276F84